MVGEFQLVLIQLFMEVNKIEIFLVVKQSISGWSQKNVMAYNSKSLAEKFVNNQRNQGQYLYKIEIIKLNK